MERVVSKSLSDIGEVCNPAAANGFFDGEPQADISYKHTGLRTWRTIRKEIEQRRAARVKQGRLPL